MAGGVPSSRLNRSSVTSELLNSISRLRRGDALMAGGVPSSRLNRSSVTSELLQKPQVVLVEEPDVRRAAAQHRDALDATAEGEALISRGVVANPPQHVGMDHAAARRFDPAFSAADAALRIAALARDAIERDLRGRLREREVVDAETDLALAAEDLAREGIEDTLEVRHRQLLVDGETLVLEEDALPDRVGRLIPIAAAGNDDANR